MASHSTLDNRLVTVMGGSGFLGHYVAQSLLRRGARLRIASRNPEKAHALRPLANLGQLQLVRCDIGNRRSVEAAVHGCDAVVNLVGTFTGDLDRVMGSDAGDLARAAREAGASGMVHVSAIGADASSSAAYAQAKALGEKRVRDAFPQATILRPSLIFGKDDSFINLFAGLVRMMPVLPVFAPDAPLQLVHADDVAEAVAVALEDPAAHGGKTYELGGPEQITMLDLHRRIAAAQGRKRTFVPMPDGVSQFFAALPLTPMSTDQWTLLKAGNTVARGAAGFARLGIEPSPLGLYLDKWMVRYRRHGRFDDRMRGSAA